MLPREWDATKHGPDGPATVLVPLNRSDEAWLHVASLLRVSCPSAKLAGLQRVQWPLLWEEFVRFRDHYLGEDANERLLFHGTGPCSASDLFAHRIGLDPRFSSGGFYGNGIYLAEHASYPVGGRYAHRVAGSGGTRLQLLLVRASLGAQQELGQRIDNVTRAMRMPDVRSDGPTGARFESVRTGPHRPFQSGTGESSLDASVIHVVYESRQLYPQYVLEIEFDMAPDVAATLASASAEAPSSNAGSSSSTLLAPTGPSLKRACPSGPSGASVLAAAAVPIAPADQLTALVAALVRKGPPAKKTKVVAALVKLLCKEGEAERDVVAAAGGIEVLVGLVRDGSLEGKTASAEALGILAEDHDGRSASIAAAEGIEALVALVRDGSPEGKRAAADTLGHLAEYHDGRKQSIAAAGGIEVLVALVRDGSPEGKTAAADAMAILADDHDGRKQSITAAGGIEVLVALLRDGSPEGKTASAEALTILASDHDGRKESIAAAGGIEALVVLMRDVSPEGKTASAEALSILANDHDGRKESIAVAGGVKVLVQIRWATWRNTTTEGSSRSRRRAASRFWWR